MHFADERERSRTGVGTLTNFRQSKALQRLIGSLTAPLRPLDTPTLLVAAEIDLVKGKH